MKPAAARALKYSCVLIYACMTMLLSFIIAYYVTHDSFSFDAIVSDLMTLLLINLIIVLALLPLFNLLNTDLRSIGLVELLKIGYLVLALFIVSFTYQKIWLPNIDIRWCIVYVTIYFVLLSCGFFVKRIYFYLKYLSMKFSKKSNSIRTMIVGAGGAGRMLIQEILSTNKIVMNPVCLIDDDKSKKGMRKEDLK